MLIFFDTETTGFARFGQPHTVQPYMVQLGALIQQADGSFQEFNQIVKPEGWTVPEEAARVHGFTTEICNERGRPLADVMKDFRDLIPCRVEDATWIAHNSQFDVTIVSACCQRLTPPRSFKPGRVICTMELSTPICKIPSRRGYKWPTLQEAHRHFTGEEFEGAHDAMADVRACRAVFEHLCELGKVAA